MERVQFQQEQMLLELKDLVDKNLFTEKETKQIMKKRTTFETTLVRRVAKKADFLRYITYEMGLEQLRRKRIARLNLPPTPQTVSDYALVRRQFHIFERALKRFKSDVGLWIQYIQLAKREGARALVGRITARALQLHPNQAGLYILAASHELDHLSPSAARTLLQRGIRMNPESVDLWREYVRMELGFIESLRRRWDVLGISLIGTAQSKANKDKGQVDPSEHIQFGEGVSDDIGSEGESQEGGGAPNFSSTTERDNVGEMDGDEGAAARRQIMQGGIVKSVMTSAAEALPQIGLFMELKTLITEYPSPGELRTSLLDHLYDLVRSTLPDDAQAARLLADRHAAAPELKGAKLVDGVQRANEELFAKAKMGGQEDMFRAYADFIEDWCQRATIDQDLKVYLISSLQALIQQCRQASPSLLSAHIRLLMQQTDTADASGAEKVIHMARKYTSKRPESSQVWLARLGAEKRFRVSGEEGQMCVERAWREARSLVTGKEEDVLKVWIWGLGDEEEVSELVGDKLETHKILLKESMGEERLRGVHERLLMCYVTVMHEAVLEEETSDQTREISAKWLDEVRLIGRRYLTTDRVWQNMFRVIGDSDTWREGKEEVLGAVYREWREKNRVEAVVEWGRWLVQHGKGGEASAMVACATRTLEEDERLQVEKLWREALDK